MPVERTVSEWRDGKWWSENRRLSDFRSARAYVLLGEPGSGKTTAFEVESKADGNTSIVPARRFIRRHVDSHPEWRCGTLFVDGLDELRAGGGDPNEPLDAFLCRIERLGQPRFRLSCREDAWLGRNDFEELASVTGREGCHLLRLDPLGSNEALAILEDMEVEYPNEFLLKAVDYGLAVFIQNPLLLEILADAVASGSWPDGRLDMFERASEELAKELNEQHLNAQDGRPFSTSKIVLAAGRLSALLLLSGKSGWSRRGRGNEDCPALSEAGDSQDLFKVALDTQLFEGSSETGRRPRHRVIGEFLAAKYLDHAIREEHLAPGRVLAWMLGIDGVVMPDLRGMSVWLAAMNSQVRGRLIESDPVGLAFHGNAERFSHQETRCLLDGLEAKLPHLREWPSRPALAALVAGPAREILWEMLRAVERSKARQAVVELLLWGMIASPRSGFRIADGKPSRHAEEAHETLGAVVRDPSWQSTTRHQALVALIHVVGNEADSVSMLRDLLDDLAADKVPADERGDLQGELLIHLYPRHLAVEHIWDYLSYGTVPGSKTRVFWTQHLVHKAPKEDVGSLLDTLAARAEDLIPRLAQDKLDTLVMRLLARGLELFGEEREVAKLYEWFELVEADYERPGLVPAHCEQVRFRSRHPEEQKPIYRWLCVHPAIQRALVLEGLKRHAEWPSTTALDMTIGTKFLGNTAPAGFRQWCLARAVELATTDPGLSTELAWWAVRKRPEWDPALGDDEVTAAVQGVSQLQEWNQKRLAREEAPPPESPAVAEFRRRKEAYVASVHRHMDTIQVGQGPPDMLYELGQVYVHGLEADGPDQARSDLEFHLDRDTELVEAVIRGFRHLVDRRDLPDLNGIMRLHGKSMMSFFAFPFLAGLTEDEMAGTDLLQRLNDQGLGRALGFYLLSRLPTKRRPLPRVFALEEDCRPSWYRQALRDRPQVVADAFVAVHRVRVRTKEPPDQHLYDLAGSDEYAEVARLAVPRMFTPFPSRCARGPQLEILRQVLWAARRHMCAAALLELIQRRLARTGMDTGQHAQWLAVGALTAPDEMLPKLVDFLSEKGETRSRRLEQRVHHLVDFLVPHTDPLPNQEWPTAHLATLIGAVGRWVRPSSDYGQDSSDRFKAVRIAETDIKAPPLVQHWIDTLAERVDEQAIAALGNLVEDPALETWHGQLVRARDAQAERLRIEKYRVPTLSEIREAMDGGAPASAADLAALVTEKLNRLADRIRNGNTDDWLQYWHIDPKDPQGRTVTEPKPENLCRDHLLSDLQDCLSSYGVDAAPEGHHAEDTRSDILTVHDTHAIPVEIKKTGRDLWSAIKDQLIAKYVRDPRSGGYGIYLVLWFGPEHLKSPSPGGERPDSPDRLRQLLEETLKPEQSRTITIVVVDVSDPRDQHPSGP